MVKRRRYARKKRSYKKKMYKKRGFKGGKLKTNYDGTYYAKLHYEVPLRFDNLYGYAHMNLPWGLNGASDNFNYYIDDNDEFN